MNKYILTPILAGLALVACSKVTPDAPIQDKEINFEAYSYVNSTKADGHSEFSTNSTFNVNAYYTGESAWASASLSDAVLYMPNVEISYQDPVWKATTGTYYWPKAGQLSFIGFTGWSSAPTNGSAKSSLLSFTQTIEVDSDPMVSDIATDLSANPTQTYYRDGVPMLFHHVASQLQFKAVADGETGAGQGLEYEILLTKVEVKNMKTSGTYIVNGTNATVSGEWSNQGTNASRVIFEETNGTTVNTSSAEVGTFGTVLPQELPTATGDNDLKALVSYTIVVKNATTHTQLASKDYNDQVVSLRANNITKWEPNKRYIYTIKIKPVSGEIVFDPAVANWADTVNAGEINL